jgi:hypothetical protein
MSATSLCHQSSLFTLCGFTWFNKECRAVHTQLLAKWLECPAACRLHLKGVWIRLGSLEAGWWRIEATIPCLQHPALNYWTQIESLATWSTTGWRAGGTKCSLPQALSAQVLWSIAGQQAPQGKAKGRFRIAPTKKNFRRGAINRHNQLNAKTGVQRTLLASSYAFS